MKNIRRAVFLWPGGALSNDGAFSIFGDPGGQAAGLFLLMDGHLHVHTCVHGEDT